MNIAHLGKDDKSRNDAAKKLLILTNRVKFEAVINLFSEKKLSAVLSDKR